MNDEVRLEIGDLILSSSISRALDPRLREDDELQGVNDARQRLIALTSSFIIHR